jgi:phosphatidylglycerophosphate synthase
MANVADAAAALPPATESLLALTQAPPDRLWRYPICRKLVPALVGTPITPNHVTFLHAALGLSVGFVVAQGTLSAFVIAALMCEVRAILDCLDGVLARATGQSSPLGRTLDQLGDTIAFLSLLAGGVWCLSGDHGWLGLGVLYFLITAASASCAASWDFFTRRLHGLVRNGTDPTAIEYLALCRLAQESRAFSVRYSRFIATYQWWILAPKALRVLRARVAAQDWPDPDEVPPPTPLGEAVREDARTGASSLRRALTFVGFVTADNLMFLMSVALVAGVMPEALPLIGAFGVAIVVATVVVANRYLASAQARLPTAPSPETVP